MSRPVYRNPCSRRRTRLAAVALDSGTAPATLIWTGDVADRGSNTSRGNTNWVFDLLPHNGDSLVLPNTSQHQANTNDLTGLVVNNITVNYGGSTAVIRGNAVTLTG